MLRRIWRILPLLVPLALLLCCAGAIFGIYFWPEISVKHSFYPYTNSTFVYEAHAKDYGSGVSRHSYYYLTSDSLSQTRDYFNTIYPQLMAGNAASDWLITGYDTNNLSAMSDKPSTKHQILTHDSFCELMWPPNCATIALLETSRPVTEGNMSQVVYPYAFGGQNPALIKMLDNLPKAGMLIVFTYNTRH